MIKTKFGSVIWAVVFLLHSATSFGGDLDSVFQKLKDSGDDYRVEGSECEQVARLELERAYPRPTYTTATGIIYAQDREVFGELDVVVFEAKSGKAVLISEVKCWRNLAAAQQKAREQRQRFQLAMSANVKLEFYSAKPPFVRYNEQQFRGAIRFISISQRGGEKLGFDITLDYELSELKELRQRLLACQARGECRRFWR